MNIRYKKLYRQPSTYIIGLGVILAAFALVAGLFLFKPNASALAGQGTLTQPLLISNCEDLQSIGDESSTYGKYYELTTSINCSATSAWNDGLGFKPINDFAGVLDGKGYTISNLTINWGDSSEVGIFSSLDDAMIANLKINNAAVSGYETVGALAGYTSGSTIFNVHITNTSVSSLYGSVGGFIGDANSEMTLERVTYNGTVTNTDNGSFTGGLIGVSDEYTKIANVRVNADVSSAGNYSGGLIGQAESYGVHIGNVAVTGSVAGVSNVGGLFGRMYSGDIYVTDSFIDVAVSGTGTDVATIVGRLSGPDVVFDNFSYDATTGAADNLYGTSGNVPNTNGITARNSDGEDSSYFFNITHQPMTTWDYSSIWLDSETTYPVLATTVATFNLPDAPTNVSVSFPQYDYQPFASWQTPDEDGGLDLTKYVYQYRSAGTDWEQLGAYTGTRSINEPNYEFTPQRLGKDFEFRVAAKNAYGIGAWATVTFSTPDPVIHDIASCEALQAIDEEPSTRFDTIRLVSDIDCTGVAYQAIGNWGSTWNDNGFYGVFDGQGHTISNIDIYTMNGQGLPGLFTRLKDSEVKNLTITDSSFGTEFSIAGAIAGEAEGASLTNVHLKNSEVITGYSQAGGLIGTYYFNNTTNPSSIENSSVTNNVIRSGEMVGGLIANINAYDGKALTIKNSFASGNQITANEAGTAGGIIGYLNSYVSDLTTDAHLYIQDAYSRNTISASASIGGAIGRHNLSGSTQNFGTNISITNFYGADTVIVTNDAADAYVGGILGNSEIYQPSTITIQSSFAAPIVTTSAVTHIGSLVGLNPGQDFLTINNSHYYSTNGFLCADTAAYPGCSSVGSAAAFKGNTDQAPISAWNFEGVWQVVDGDYPILQGFPIDTPTNPAEDADNDGVLDSQENAAPNNGDANNDGIADSEQANVTSIVNAISGAYTTLQINDSCRLESVTTQSTDGVSVKDSAYSYAHGLLSFEAACGTPGFSASVVIYQYGSVNDAAVVRKYNPNTSAYFLVQGASIERTLIGGQSAAIARYTVTDGGVLDVDGQANGTIVDPVGFATLSVGAPNTGLGGNNGNARR